MVIGVPKEIKPEENRVAIVPGGVETLVHKGHKVIIERGAGFGSGFNDEEYIRAGAQIFDRHEDVFDNAELVLKVKEPLPEEYGLLKAGQIFL
jgi:alanine dehydrogenase